MASPVASLLASLLASPLASLLASLWLLFWLLFWLLLWLLFSLPLSPPNLLSHCVWWYGSNKVFVDLVHGSPCTLRAGMPKYLVPVPGGTWGPGGPPGAPPGALRWAFGGLPGLGKRTYDHRVFPGGSAWGFWGASGPRETTL